MSTFRPLLVRIRLDGSGVYYDPSEPPMLDGLLSAAVCRHHVSGDPPSRDEAPDEIPLPLSRWRLEGSWGWRASALFPTDADGTSTLVYWRKRLRTSRMHVVKGSPNTTNGTYRDWNMPLPLLLCHELRAWAVGDRRRIKSALRSIRHIGKKRAHGRGRVLDIDIVSADGDQSLERAGCAQRWLPDPNGIRRVRTRPPYWSSVDAVPCCEVGAVRSGVAAE